MMLKKKQPEETTQLAECPPAEEERKPGKFKVLIMKIGKRNAVIACAVLLIGAAVLLNWILFSGGDDKGYDGYDQPSGGTVENGDAQNVIDETNAYFSATQVSRQRARDEAMEVLQAVAENPESADAAKSEALAGITAIADEIQKEADIESLITAKGFAQCVAVLNGENATIVVKADDLQTAEIAQINAIVYEQAGISPSGVTIIRK